MLKFSACTLLITILLVFKQSSARGNDDSSYLGGTSEKVVDAKSHGTTEIINASIASSSLLARQLMQSLEDRITNVLSKATTAECRDKIAAHFYSYLDALGHETSFPFLESHFENTCPEPIYNFEKLPRGITIEDIMNRTYQPPRDVAEYIDDPNQLRILYGILTHDHPESTIRLIEALYEEGHLFVIHVDGKNASNDTYHSIVEYAKDRSYVHVLKERIRVNWGGFSLVNATYVFFFFIRKLVHLDYGFKKRNLTFSYFMHLLLQPSNA